MEPGGEILTGINANRLSPKDLIFLSTSTTIYHSTLLSEISTALHESMQKRGAEGAIGPYKDFGRK